MTGHDTPLWRQVGVDYSDILSVANACVKPFSSRFLSRFMRRKTVKEVLKLQQVMLAYSQTV